jgi:hypothetical protein
MTLYLFATLLASALLALALGDAGQASPMVWSLPLLPALAWTALRFGNGGQVAIQALDRTDAGQPLAHFALHSGQPALLAEGGASPMPTRPCCAPSGWRGAVTS